MSLLDDHNEQPTVIDIDLLSSDIEAEVLDSSAKDDEIDLLNDKEIEISNETSNYSNLILYKKRFRDLVHALRNLNRKLGSQRERYERRDRELTLQIAALQDKKDGYKKQNPDSISLINVASEGDITSRQSFHKQSSKLRDLEKLLSKCKESLKAKNQQLRILKDSLLEVEKFKEYMNGVKNELKDLRQAHETWTLSIAENKRVMHQEIEDKNLEIDKLKADIKHTQAQLKDSNKKSILIKANIQQLESRLVSTSAAHQKERESLTKELLAAKNNAIKQLQKDHDLQLERVKLDLERSIENLKLELLVKDEQIIRKAEREKHLQEQNCTLKTDLENTKEKLEDAQRELSELRLIRDQQIIEIADLKASKDEIKVSDTDTSGLEFRYEELQAANKGLAQQVEELTDRLSSADATSIELEDRLKLKEEAMNDLPEGCEKCIQLQAQIGREAEQYEQTSFELKTQLELMTTANSDQEKIILDLKSVHAKAIESHRMLRIELDESIKRNETISRNLQENETEVQNLQDQLKQMSFIQQQLEASRRENNSLTIGINQVTSELNERSVDLKKSQSIVDDLKRTIVSLEQEMSELKQEKQSLAGDLAEEYKLRKDFEQQILVSILAAMKNLETPDTSPGSDKTYKPEVIDTNNVNNQSYLPDALKLVADLSSLALDKSNAYSTSNQRLQAVLLDNKMINEELQRLKAELNILHKEKTNEVLISLEEVDRLRTENQALIYDQKVYDDQVLSLESEIEKLKFQISEYSHSDDVPDATEFKYLKNIVYQFMVGREPTTLARVISAVFKFEQEQVEQICRVQEAIHQITS